MLSNVTHSNSYFECNKKRGCIDQLYIELGRRPHFQKSPKTQKAEGSSEGPVCQNGGKLSGRSFGRHCL